jgi:CheY-like chemotaxis protein
LNILLSHKAAEKKLTLMFDYDSNIPDILLGDPTRLTQIILNIVGNAIKFTKKGTVEVFAKLVSSANEMDEVEISVKDTGIGIPEDKLDFIFERFRQAETHTTRNYGGTGLGLSIAKQLIELQGGSLRIKSMEGVGSVFSFTLPFKKPVESYKTSVNPVNDIDFSKLGNLSILLVEDNVINVKFVQSLFLQYNLKVDTAENGKKGIEKLESNNYDLVLMDIEMPEMNGYEATRYIREKMNSAIPIIAMTAHAMAGEREKCMQLGMNDYISKPINSELLFKKMLIFATNRKPYNVTASMTKIMNLDLLSRTVNGNKKVIIDIMNVF